MRWWPFSRTTLAEVQEQKLEAMNAAEKAKIAKEIACVKLERAETLEQEIIKMNARNGYSESLTFAFRGKEKGA